MGEVVVLVQSWGGGGVVGSKSVGQWHSVPQMLKSTQLVLITWLSKNMICFLPSQRVTSCLVWQQNQLNMLADMIFITLPFASSGSGYERISFVCGQLIFETKMLIIIQLLQISRKLLFTIILCWQLCPSLNVYIIKLCNYAVYYIRTCIEFSLVKPQGMIFSKCSFSFKYMLWTDNSWD